MIAARGNLDGEAVEVTCKRRPHQPVGTEADRRRSRDLLWLLQYRNGWSIERIALVNGVNRSTVWRRIRQMEARANG